jgi:hypothetical protein
MSDSLDVQTELIVYTVQALEMLTNLLKLCYSKFIIFHTAQERNIKCKNNSKGIANNWKLKTSVIWN